MGNCELATFTTIAAWRARKDSEVVLVAAAGENPSGGCRMELRASPLTIVPPEYSLLRCRDAAVTPPIVSPYRFTTVLRLPEGVDAIVVHHAGGRDEVPIQQAGPELADLSEIVAPAAEQDAAAGGTSEAIGFSASMSFDEAFADAILHLPGMVSIDSSRLVVAKVVDSGALFGGIAGLHHFYVRIRGGSVG